MATTTSRRAFVWTWLPVQTEPVPVGVLEYRNNSSDLSFRYGDRYVEREDAISLYGPELPLEGGRWFDATANLGMPGCLRDASPDSWGRRVIVQRATGRDDDTGTLDELTYLLESGSNRLGATDFQESSSTYIPRAESATLTELHQAAQILAAGGALSPDLARALVHGTAVGGARPKVQLRDADVEYIAKFSTADDPMDVVGAEAASMVMARAAGIPVAGMRIVRSLGKKVLMMERFDRGPEGTRRMIVSALTMIGAPESFMPVGSYADVLDVLRLHGAPGSVKGSDLFRRITFNIAISNTEDHLRNHAAFWDGFHLRLTPAYDLSPTMRSGETAAQALSYGRHGERIANFSKLMDQAPVYDLTKADARAIVDEVIAAMERSWEEAAEAAELTASNRNLMWGRQFLNPGSLHGL